MDEVIYEEFKGTGNMELHLSRKIAENEYSQQLITTVQEHVKEELLTSQDELQKNVDPA